LYRKRPPRIVNRTIPKIIAISVHTVNRSPLDFTLFFQEQQRLVGSIPYRYKRYLYDQIRWDERCLLITGQRGVGKTTMILQHLKEHYKDDTSALYISVDNPYFKNISLYEFAREFEKFGGEVLYIDEIHKYDEWSTHIKSIYDATELKLVISGSSMIQIHTQESDLSRRVLQYRLANLYPNLQVILR